MHVKAADWKKDAVTQIAHGPYLTCCSSIASNLHSMPCARPAGSSKHKSHALCQHAHTHHLKNRFQLFTDWTELYTLKTTACATPRSSKRNITSHTQRDVSLLALPNEQCVNCQALPASHNKTGKCHRSCGHQTLKQSMAESKVSPAGLRC